MSYRRTYIRRNGRTQYRENSGQRRDEQRFDINGDSGVVCRYWSPIYCQWVWEAQLMREGLIYKREFTGVNPLEAQLWLYSKQDALQNPQFARTLGEYITDSNFTHEDLASLSDLTKATIAKWISGEMYPNIPSLVRICKIIFEDEWFEKYEELSQMIELER